MNHLDVALFAEDMRGGQVPAWDRLRDWSAAIARELASKSEVATRSLASTLLRERHLPWHYQVVTRQRPAMRHAAGRGAQQHS